MTKKTIISFATVLCLIPKNAYGCQYKITGNGLAAGCQLFYRKIYGFLQRICLKLGRLQDLLDGPRTATILVNLL